MEVFSPLSIYSRQSLIKFWALWRRGRKALSESVSGFPFMPCSGFLSVGAFFKRSEKYRSATPSSSSREFPTLTFYASSYVLLDTPGQIEIFTWSASGAIITDAVAASFPTVVAYVIDTARTTAPATFMSNMLYACRWVPSAADVTVMYSPLSNRSRRCRHYLALTHLWRSLVYYTKPNCHSFSFSTKPTFRSTILLSNG